MRKKRNLLLSWMNGKCHRAHFFNVFKDQGISDLFFFQAQCKERKRIINKAHLWLITIIELTRIFNGKIEERSDGSSYVWVSHVRYTDSNTGIILRPRQGKKSICGESQDGCRGKDGQSCSCANIHAGACVLCHSGLRCSRVSDSCTCRG